MARAIAALDAVNAAVIAAVTVANRFNCTLLERRFTTPEEQNSYVQSRPYWVRNYRDTRDMVRERVVKSLTQQIAHLEGLRGRLEAAPPRRSGPVNVQVYGGTFGQFNVDALVKNIDTQITGVVEQGQPAVAEALHALAAAFANARLPKRSAKKHWRTWSWLLPRQPCRRRSAKGGWLKSALGYLKEIAGAAQDVKQVWGDVEPVLMDVLPPG